MSIEPMLLREAALQSLVEDAADSQPKSLADPLVDHHPADIKARLRICNEDTPAGKDSL